MEDPQHHHHCLVVIVMSAGMIIMMEIKRNAYVHRDEEDRISLHFSKPKLLAGQGIFSNAEVPVNGCFRNKIKNVFELLDTAQGTFELEVTFRVKRKYDELH